jgi:hypothetical protein
VSESILALIVAFYAGLLFIIIGSQWKTGPEGPCPRHPDLSECAHRKRK